MRLVELILNEDELADGVEAISIVKHPAIESNFIALSKQQFEFKAADEEKKILLGPALIPNKPIIRNQLLNGEVQEFYCYFSKSTIERVAQLYLMNGYQANATLEHELDINGVTLVESWIKVDAEKDKSVAYGFNDPIGTWYVAMKVENDEIWNDWVKTGKVKGFSIEGYFADKATLNMSSTIDEVKSILREWKNTTSKK